MEDMFEASESDPSLDRFIAVILAAGAIFATMNEASWRNGVISLICGWEACNAWQRAEQTEQVGKR